MKDYEYGLVPKCFTKEANLNRPRRSRSHRVKVSLKNTWGPMAQEYLREHGSLHLSVSQHS